MADSRTGSRSPVKPVPPERLRRTCDPAQFRFASTADLKPPKGILGQDRAIEAIEVGTGIPHDGFNMFVLGARGCGMHAAVVELLEARAENRQAPSDWVYVNNFDAADKPDAICLPPGRAVEFRDAMDAMIEDLHAAARAMFEAEEYQSRRRAIESSFKQRQETAFAELQKKAEELGTAVLHTPQGFAVAPMRNGEVLKPDQFKVLGEAERRRSKRRSAPSSRNSRRCCKACPS